VFVATQPIDFRKGVHGLVALVADGLAGAPYSWSAPLKWSIPFVGMRTI
jgi:hypothetical protein